jgi:DNA polymerase I-like protein with 3'-5' exonuclease and polymerase domains
MNEIESDLQALFPPIVEERYSEKTGKRLKDKVHVFNVGSRQQVAERLTAKGAVWKELTATGKPVVDEKTLKENHHVPEAAQVLEYLLLQKRYAQVNSWIEHVQEDGRVHGRVITNGAVTGRMTHQSPNMAQVPSVNSEYGEDCRNCWIVPEGRRLVGVDASGLELRMLAHYMGDEEFTNVLLRDDIHTRNQTAAGLATRPQAKTFIYAFLYGAGDAKIGSIVGGTAKDGNALRTRFLRNTPSLEGLRERVGQASRKGHLIGLDGRRLWIRSEHSALNTLLQAAGAIIMKKALVLLDDYATQHKIDYKFVGNVHDEIQSEVATEQAEKFGWLAVECIKAAGLSFELRCPLDGEYKVGSTWTETH